MTDTKISQLSSMLQGMKNMASTVETSKKAEAAFGALLNQTAGKGYEEQYSWTSQIGKNSVAVGSNQVIYEKEAAQNNFKDTSFVKASSSDITSKLSEDAQEQIETVVTEVKNVLKEKLGVSEEELVHVMEELGLTVLDLSEPTKVTQLVMELTGSQDGSELLVNQDFQTLMSQITELFGQLTEGLNLTTEELQQLSKQLTEMQQNIVVEEVPEQVQTENVSEVEVKTEIEPGTELQDNIVLAEAEETVTQSELKTKEKTVSDTAKQVETEVTEEVEEKTLVKQIENVTEEDTSEESNSDESKQKTATAESDVKPQAETKGQQTQVSFQTTTQTINNGQTVEVVQTVTQSQIDVESILRQISQMTRISVTQAQSSIEMQLNPENLGKVYLQVISKDGAITAQIAAQNEAVKEVLESQIAVLKENMNQQGMKVEAIEVTVASHEFERNLEENQGNPSKEQQEAEKPSRRGINLNNLDELEGVMSEEETLAAKIMRDNGNSVDLTA
ncbi:flagellar hook-length control protein FliK [Roseburia sp. 499]|uniref:flagellar hook-length control protein FliK n=1 Tax=Roseburia sp. 499 TaxID=1261634 RepID=UPI000952D6E6|nr:flagellar hook-length control protein FliK [Roseburia sp. 499]WVK71217.1 flagellar hook-length control protein FliK [Roseburia sp. 499]